MRPSVLISVLTLGRPRMLRALLDSLAAMEPFAPGFHALVVDNDPDGSARTAVEEWAARMTGFPVSYEIETRRGVPFGRNRCLAFARANGLRYVATIDDDVRARPDWLSRLYDAMIEQSAEAACGAVRFEADGETDAVGRELLRQRNMKRERAFQSTCCCLLDAEALNKKGLSFDERFASKGGEDTDLFQRLRESGGRIALVNERLVTETVPASRLTLSWHFARAARVSAFRSYQAGEKRGRAAASFRFLPQAAGNAVIGAGQALISPAAGLKFVIRATKKAGAAYGLALGCFGKIPGEYEKTHGS